MYNWERNLSKPKRFHQGSDYPQLVIDGIYHCRWCKDPLKSKSRSFCGKPCRQEFWMRVSSSGFRAAVFRRDKGICAACSVDTERLKRIFWHATTGMSSRAIWNVFEQIGYTYNRSFWDADHILEFADGGDHFDMNNVQTLCVPCHKYKTAQWRKTRGKRQRA